MATNVKVITAYCDLGLTKRPAEEFHAYGRQLEAALGQDLKVYRYAAEECWTWEPYKAYPAANARAYDRFAHDHEHQRSNLIQHAPVQFLQRARWDYPNVDVFVWLGYSILKQGDHTNRRIKTHHITSFVDKMASWTPVSLPFPGMTEWIQPVDPFGDNWRFCGSTLVVPAKHVAQVSRSYRASLQAFVMQHGAIPLDLAIWPMVEFSSGLPWSFYPAEYDFTQLTRFPFQDMTR